MGYLSSNFIHLTGYVQFDKGGVYSVDGSANRTSGSSFSGTGRFGSSINCTLAVTSES